MIKIGIIGLPNVGKSLLFKALTKRQVDISDYPFCTIEPNIGIVSVPDQRLEKLAKISQSKKIVPVIIEFVDIAGLIKGASKGEGLGNKFLSHIRGVHAILEVVRIFKNKKVISVDKEIDPVSDIEVIKTELILADLQTIEKRMLKLKRKFRQIDKKVIKELEILKKIKGVLNENRFAIDYQKEIKGEQEKIINNLYLLTSKPILYLYNFSGEIPNLSPELKEKNYLLLDVKLEEELTEMSEQDKKGLGIKSNLDQLIIKSFELLDLIVFFTIIGGKEARAWDIKRGTKVLNAGGVVHSDFKEKFIKAEVAQYSKLLKSSSWQKAKKLGIIRTEGKEYIVQEGDVIVFKI